MPDPIDEFLKFKNGMPVPGRQKLSPHSYEVVDHTYFKVKGAEDAYGFIYLVSRYNQGNAIRQCKKCHKFVSKKDAIKGHKCHNN